MAPGPAMVYNMRPLGAIRQPDYGVWRSLVARIVRDDEVPGSNPGTPTR